jgi:hypothetical protein
MALRVDHIYCMMMSVGGVISNVLKMPDGSDGG